ncbi:hypothetical protein ACGFK1_04780 [Mycobacterium sp. NPDC048908]|uniref:hypothetical protein n=1 Tax=Mycobacterium sp. NPDC048908 TaxID=3364292 RepID=UPI00371F11E9
MPLQNRVAPGGEIITSPARGTLMGNRGILHDDNRQIVRTSRNAAWLICRLEFKGRRRQVMSPGTYTELFFLDEAVALAAGHRPCGECRREQYRSYMAAVNAAGEVKVEGATNLDRRLRKSRQASRGTSALVSLPDGVFVTLGDNDYRLIWNRLLHRWTPMGYIDAVEIVNAGVDFATVVTPSLSVAALRHGYAVDVHPSSRGGTDGVRGDHSGSTSHGFSSGSSTASPSSSSSS